MSGSGPFLYKLCYAAPFGIETKSHICGRGVFLRVLNANDVSEGIIGNRGIVLPGIGPDSPAGVHFVFEAVALGHDGLKAVSIGFVEVLEIPDKGIVLVVSPGRNVAVLIILDVDFWLEDKLIV